MLTAGVDLAAASKGTALATIAWSTEGAALTGLHLGVADEQIVEASASVAKLGIDCALGWPDGFVDFVVAHSDPTSGARFDGGLDWRRTLAYRETDRRVRAVTGRWPLSVSTDRLGLTAMRCAGLLGRLSDRGLDVDRSGSGLVAEVYPGATLRLWGFDTSGYRTSAESRSVLLERITTAAPWLDPRGQETLMIASGDAFDAVVAALGARAAAIGHADAPGPAELDRARREGWVALPTVSLPELDPRR